jgi:hypothetical protein
VKWHPALIDNRVRSVLGAGLSSLPWCCITPAAFAVSGVAAAGIGTALHSATPVFLILSASFLARALYLTLVKHQGPTWVRIVVLVSTPAIALPWAFRLGFWPW